MKSFAIITLAAFAVTGTFAQTVSDEDAAARVEEVRLMEEARAVERLAVEEARRAASRPHCTCPYGTVDSDVQCFEGEDPVACNPFIGCDPRDDTGEHQLIRKPDGRAYCTPAVFSCECDNGWVDPTATCYSYQEQACTACRDPLSHQLILIEETGHKFCTPHTYPCTCRGGIPLENPSKPCYLDGQVSCASCDSQDFILTRMRNSHHYCHFVDDEVCELSCWGSLAVVQLRFESVHAAAYSPILSPRFSLSLSLSLSPSATPTSASTGSARGEFAGTHHGARATTKT